METPSPRGWIPSLVVGLGNPGPRFVGTRHNVGFEVLDELARRHSLEWTHAVAWKADVAASAGNRLRLLKPMTFMNASGEAVIPFQRFFRIPAEAVLVVMDDIALETGRLRIRPAGSDGGQKGLRSILQLAGTDQIPRLRIGVGPPPGVPGQRSASSHVLGKFSEEERLLAADAVRCAADAVERIFDKGLDSAMNFYNATQPNRNE